MRSFSEGCKMLLVGFTVWAIVCLRHSWKVMWTRLADWLVMSNSLPQREDELLCGLHGWVVYMCAQSCALGDPLKTSCLSLRSGRKFQDVPSRIPITSGGSTREAEYQWGQSDIRGSLRGRHSFGAERDESGGLRMWTRAFIQRRHGAIFQRALLTPSLSLLHIERDLILWSMPQRANIKAFDYFLYLITSINYWI